MPTWKRDFASGLIVLVPLIVTVWVVYWLFGLIEGLVPSGILIEELVIDIGATSIAVHALAEVLITLAIFALIVLAVGYLMRTAVGTLVEGAIDDAMNQVPGLRVVYNASKMAIETALSDTTTLQEPVKLHTWENIRMTAFKTGRRAPDDRVLLFLPTAPNITSGFVIEVEEDEIIETDESVEDALTRILSAGFGEKGSEPGIPIEVAREREDEDASPIPVEGGEDRTD